ncbi:MAG: AAA family ATPase [Armatimonadetes bacterium]|nr:AAA family ATPase [Armatimonadota bacterium]
MSSQAKTALPVVPAANLDEPDAAGRWLVETLWPRAGVGIIGGAPKCGKSWLALDLAVSVASGTPCLDTFAVAASGGVLVYMAEDAGSVVKERLAGICSHRSLDLAGLPIGVITAPSLRLDLPRDQARLLETVRRHAPRLLLLDPFVRLHRVNENHAQDVSAVLGYLRQLQRAHDLALVVVHHARKNGGSSGGQSLRGSSDFFAWVDTALAIRRQRQQLVLSAEHRAARAGDPIALVLAGTERDMHLAVVPAEQCDDRAPATADLDSTVLAALDSAGQTGLSRQALRTTVRVRNQSLTDALTRLAASGRITRHDDSWVRLPIPIPAHIDTRRNGNRNGGALSG